MNSRNSSKGAVLTSREKPPESIVNRESEWVSISSTTSKRGSGNIHIHGPRGSGKTLIAQRAIEGLPESAYAFYIPCTVYDTQYQVLEKLYEEATDDEMSGGYHTSQLQLKLSETLGDRETVIILDEVDFLLENEGGDLLYYLSRAGNQSKSIITISSNSGDLSIGLDERSYSSLRPYPIEFERYSEAETARILSRKAHPALQRTEISKGALRLITTKTKNVRLALHWLAAAIKHGKGEFNENVVYETRAEALRNYWETLISDFSYHHRLVLDSILELMEDTDQIMAGQVYEHYGSMCMRLGVTRLSDRRISDFLRHLELLEIIHVDYHYGGEKGKTRVIQLVDFS